MVLIYLIVHREDKIPVLTAANNSTWDEGGRMIKTTDSIMRC